MDDTAVLDAAGLRERIAELERRTEAQERTIDALMESVERAHADSASTEGSSWRKQIELERRIEERTTKLRLSEQRLRAVIDSIDSLIAILDEDGRIISVNRAWRAGSDDNGVDLEWEGVRYADFCLAIHEGHLDVGERVGGLVTDVVAGRSDGATFEIPYAAPDGSQQWFEVRARPVEDGDTARVVVTHTDVTARNTAIHELEVLHEEAQRLALLARLTDNVVIVTDAHARIEWVNRAFTDAIGYTLEEVRGQRPDLLLQGPATDPATVAQMAEQISNGQGFEGEFLIYTRRGDERWVSVEARPILTDDSQAGFIGLLRDVTDRKRHLAQLNTQKERAEGLAMLLDREKAVLSLVVTSIPNLVWWRDHDLMLRGSNDAYRQHAPRLDSSTVAAIADLERQVVQDGELVVDHLFAIDDGQGAKRFLLVNLRPLDEAARGVGLVGVAADVTDIKRLEHQLAEVNRLEAIGQLAAGVAHELNTPIQYVADNTSFLADGFDEVLGALKAIRALTADGSVPEETKEALDAILSATDLDWYVDEVPGAISQSQDGLERVAEIVRAMKEFAHPGQERSAADLNRAIESTVTVSRNEWKYVAEMETDLDPAVGRVPCLQGELKAAVLNMIVNAAHAIGAKVADGEKGRISVATRRVGENVEIVIADDGCGMSPEVQAKVFDPFFTTKEVGRGTGQGLNLAHGTITQRHGGTITVDSTPGVGTVFTITLPG